MEATARAGPNLQSAFLQGSRSINKISGLRQSLNVKGIWRPALKPLSIKASKNKIYSASAPVWDLSTSQFWEVPTSPSPKISSPNSGKGWTNEDGSKNSMIEAKARMLAVMAADRSQMHTNIGKQRDNWNQLFQGTVRLATISAAILAAVNRTGTASLNVAVGVALLNSIAGGMMLVINHFQPSQLAEEQRGAARFISSLVKEIEGTLSTDPSLREDAQTFLQDKTHRLDSIRASYPLPLTPNCLEKFPTGVHPICFTEVDKSVPEIAISKPSNGWTQEMVEDLKKVAERIREKDIEEYVILGERALKLNKVLAVVAPAFAFCAAAAAVVGVIVTKFNPSLIATVCSIMAFFSSSFSHDAQVGMVFEMYRSCASAYRDMDAMIHRTLRLPLHKRMNGELFHQYVALLLGRPANIPMVPDDGKNAGLLF